MGMSDCPECWDTPCNCKRGHLGSKNHAYEELKKDYDALKEKNESLEINAQNCFEKWQNSLDREEKLQAEVERTSDALIHQGHTLRNAMNEIDKLKNIISINHQWHQDYDDCSDYKNSELFEMNTTFKVNSSEGVG